MSTLANTVRAAVRGAGRPTASTRPRAADDPAPEEDDEETPAAEDDAPADDEEGASAAEDGEGEDEPAAEEEDDEEPVAKKAAVRAARRSAKSPRRSATAGYGLPQATQTLELCSIAGLSAKRALGFVAAKTPVAKVRETLSGEAVERGGKALGATNPTRPAKAGAADGWGDVAASVNAQHGVALPKR